MGSLVDNIKTLNSAVRTLLLATVVGVLGFACYYGYSEYTKFDRAFQEAEQQLVEANQQLVTLKQEVDQKQAEIVLLGEDLKQKIAQIEKLETSMRLLKTDQRLARLNVIEIQRDEDGKPLSCKLEFLELSPQGDALSQPKLIDLPGDVVYVDNWIVKFDDNYIEKGDIERGTSLCLFRRIFSEEQSPNEGVLLDEIGMRPQAYGRGGSISEFEKNLWAEFWEFANDREKADMMGIRAANGEAVSIKVREGKSYNIELRSSGGLSIQPVDNQTSSNDPT